MRRTYLASAAVLAWAVCAWGQGGNAYYASNQPPLKETPFVSLPLGAVRAQGWLLKQLELQRSGLTGHAEEALVELNETSAWRGGDKDNWERSPYYVKGLIPLAYTLDDPDLKQRAQKWVEWVLASQRENGFYGPTQNEDWWPRMVSNYYLRDYYEATNDPRVLPFLSKYYRHMLGALPARPLRDWGKSRAGDDMDTALWLYNRTKEPHLLELVDLLRKQAYDWPAIFHGNTFQSFGRDFQPKHNVNVPQAMKFPAVSWQRTGDAKERTAIEAGHTNLMRDNGLVIGIQSGTEFLAGRSPSQGVEFCSIVEQMLSEETIVRIFGEGKHSDRLEFLAYNALPGAWNRDLTALRYYTLPNHVTAHRGPHGFGQNYDNGTMYGPRSGFPCCCFNVHQGWPKFVQNSWAATPDNGLAAVVYAPNTVTAKVGANGATATIAQETSYPFSEEVRFKVSMSAPATFPLVLRTPEWCEGASVKVNGQVAKAAEPGAFARLVREWKTGDEVVLTLPMSVRVSRGVHQSASVNRGPLLYSLKTEVESQVVGHPAKGYAEFEQKPKTPWNYALVLDEKGQLSGVRAGAREAKAGGNPFAESPIELTALGRKVDGWTLAWNGVAAFDPPASPVGTDHPAERITLVPYGTQDLRLASFPVAGTPSGPLSKTLNFDFAASDTSAFCTYGGGWWVHDGKLLTSHMGGGTPDYKAVVESAVCSDVEIQAEVTPPSSGDAGIIFRVTNPSVGSDAYQGYYAGVNSAGTQIILGKADGRKWMPLLIVDRTVAANKGKAVVLKISAKGNRIEVRTDDHAAPVIAVIDESWKSGQVGFRIYTHDHEEAVAAFDNLSIKPVR